MFRIVCARIYKIINQVTNLTLHSTLLFSTYLDCSRTYLELRAYFKIIWVAILCIQQEEVHPMDKELLMSWDSETKCKPNLHRDLTHQRIPV